MKQEMIELITKAWARTKARLKPFFWLFVLSNLPIFLAGFSVLFAMAYFKNLSWIVVLFAVMTLVIAMVFYFWFSLASMDVVIAPAQQGVGETLMKVKPRVRGYVWFSLLYLFFVIGITPLGIMTVGVVLILWFLWSSFAFFVYLEKNKKGLENLWISRAMVRGRFWDSAGKMFIVFAPILAVALLIGLIKNAVLKGMLNMVFGLLIYPFSISFLYELYKILPEAHTAKPPKVWIILSIVGWIFVIILAVFLLLFLLRETNFTPCIDTATTRCLTS